MTLGQLEKRIAALEAEIRDLKSQLAAQTPAGRSWLGSFGAFADDPTFEEAARLGREYRDKVNRESLEEMDREAGKGRAKASGSRKKPKSRKSNARA